MIAHYPHSRQAGFTLVELIVVVAMVGILSMIAVPSYQDYMTRGRLPDATSNLAAKRIQLEQYFLDNRTYVGAAACNNDTSTSRYFDFSCVNLTATTYTLLAVGKGSMADFSFSLDQSNVKQTGSVPADWTLPTPNSCWVTAKGGRC